MERFVALTVTLILCGFVGSTYGQTALNKDFSELEVINDHLLNLDNEDWSFYQDDENEIFYVDFEKINVNLSDLLVKDAAGQVVFQDQVWDLPVNTIYEIDMKQFRKGEYEVEVRSFTGSFRKKVMVN